MAQEQAKSAPGKETSDDKEEVKGPLEAMMQGKAKGKSDDLERYVDTTAAINSR
ncbi:MAG: hypothetical protein ACTSRM_04105 [Alphaproteobacteria bacterium]